MDTSNSLLRSVVLPGRSGYQSNQATLRSRVEFQGIGLHSGVVSTLVVLPANENQGIVFRRTDSRQAEPVNARWDRISITELSTSIGEGVSRISTIEHLMAALMGLGIDNAKVEIDGPEVPILDGSSNYFVTRILESGIAYQQSPRLYYKVIKPFLYEESGKAVRLEPSDQIEYRCTISFPDPVIGRQTISYRHNEQSFMDLATARTFCHYRDVETMRRAGLALGGSLENAIVVTDEGVLNPEGLNGGDEFVRHKLLDAIGDLALTGAPLAGRITLYKSGHGVHARFMRELMTRRQDCLELTPR
jgi:UDP-3-O-[3-hydroxymyristoyl] N-acetylglucosamine deacetylase